MMRVFPVLVVLFVLFACDEDKIPGQAVDSDSSRIETIASCIRYVDEEAAESGDGLSWESAKATLEEGIACAESAAGESDTKCEVWLKDGGDSAVDQEGYAQTLSYDKDAVSIYRGFNGTETKRGKANPPFGIPPVRVAERSGDDTDGETAIIDDSYSGGPSAEYPRSDMEMVMVDRDWPEYGLLSSAGDCDCNYITGQDVGIGTSNPGVHLHVQESDASSSPTWTSSDTAVIERNSSVLLHIHTEDDNVGGICFTDDNRCDGYFRYYHGDNSLKIYTNRAVDNDPKLTIESTGDVGIGTTSPTDNLEVAEHGFPSIGISAYYNEASPLGSLYFRKSRGGSVGTHAATLSGDSVGDILFYGSSSSAWKPAAHITVIQDADTSTHAHSSSTMEFVTHSTSAANDNQLFLDSNGNIGVNNDSPGCELDVNGKVGMDYIVKNGRTTGTNAIQFQAGNNIEQWLNFRRGGTPTSSAGVIFSHFGTNHWFVHNGNGNLFFEYSTQSSDNPDVDNASKKVTITSSGDVGIGTTTPDTKLEVNGKIQCEEIEVTDVEADFVFDDDYTLMSLDEVDAYVTEHNHLPDIPSAAEIQANGIGLADMTTRLLQKIEELTLHAIEQNKRIRELEVKTANCR